MASGSHDQTKAAAVPERAKCARLSSAHAHQGRGAGRPDRGPQQREGKAAPRLERLSRVACASGGALRSVRLQMGGAPRRSLPRGTGWVMRVKAGRSSAPQVVCCFRRHLALAARPKCVLHGGREFLVHPFELLGRPAPIDRWAAAASSFDHFGGPELLRILHATQSPRRRPVADHREFQD